MAAIDWCGD